MSMYIVDCRYIRTTTPVGYPDFTVQVEAVSPGHAMLLAEKTEAYADFVATGAHDTLALVSSLRYQLRILAQFGYEMARKGREFEALASVNGIALPDEDDEDEDARTELLREEEDIEEEDHLYDLRRKEAKAAFEHYDFTAYGGVDTICGWYGIRDEEHMLLRLGGSFVADHVLAVEFEPFSDKIVHVCVRPFDIALAPSDVMSTS
jgi:hypothetical protein